tara:strand:+ start:58878 stop:60374 length:1497 start_codon:yes stop_codon:yes gene_type:complete
MVGLYKARSVKNSNDFMLAGRTLPWYILVGTLLATWMGSGSLFSGAGLGYRNGLASLWSSGGAWLGIALIYFITRRIRNIEKVTVPEIFELRYGKIAAVFSSFTTVIAYTTIVSYQFRGGGNVLAVISNGMISIQSGIIITALFAISYTAIAGMFSVVYTDVVNGLLMAVGILSTLIFLILQVGGLEEVINIANSVNKWQLFGNWHKERTGHVSGPVIAISFFVPTMLLLMGDANMYQRIFSSKDSASAKKAVLFWIIGVIILESSISMLGLTGYVAAAKGIIPDLVAGAQDSLVEKSSKAMLEARQAGSESIIPAIARFAGLPLILGVLLVSTMMAVIVSTADSFLLIPATNLTRDIYQRYINKDSSERQLILISRLFVLLFGVAALLLVSKLKTVLDAAYVAYNIYGTSITPSLLAAFTWKRATAYGAISSILMGAFITIYWKFFLPKYEGFYNFPTLLQEPTFPAAALSILALIIGSLMSTPTKKETLDKFFDES